MCAVARGFLEYFRDRFETPQPPFLSGWLSLGAAQGRHLHKSAACLTITLLTVVGQGLTALSGATVGS